MGPYVPYEFDFTAQAKEGKNQLEVAIADLIPEPGGAGQRRNRIGIESGLGGLWRNHS